MPVSEPLVQERLPDREPLIFIHSCAAPNERSRLSTHELPPCCSIEHGEVDCHGELGVFVVLVVVVIHIWLIWAEHMSCEKDCGDAPDGPDVDGFAVAFVV